MNPLQLILESPIILERPVQMATAETWNHSTPPPNTPAVPSSDVAWNYGEL